MSDEPRDEIAEALRAWQEGRLKGADFRSYIESNVRDAELRDKLLLMLDFREGGPPANR